MKTVDQYSTLSIQIEDLRKEMVFNGMQYGLTSPKVIKLSQDLDVLLNRVSTSENLDCI
ncbi:MULTISPECIES: aspartyl-phosphate phosphatase Spo0E family protein [Bacillaceae]|uniref:aspartyl-phosphate phosphatase Spo0E family protein n=1 Tax=Bacillaceae TaxID=186817 RepID=UPI000376E78F|nr:MULTISPECIES: aspartyl-phosphate phosphatase Spo0E family protein [Bacillaceae]